MGRVNKIHHTQKKWCVPVVDAAVVLKFMRRIEDGGYHRVILSGVRVQLVRQKLSRVPARGRLW